MFQGNQYIKVPDLKIMFDLILQVLTHEVCHLLGMHHCTFYSCLMNESSDVYEAESQPAFLCPICLRKLHKFLQFPIIERYELIKKFLKQYTDYLPKERRWSMSDFMNTHSVSWDCKVAPSVKNKLLISQNLKRFGDSVQWLKDVLVFLRPQAQLSFNAHD